MDTALYQLIQNINVNYNTVSSFDIVQCLHYYFAHLLIPQVWTYSCTVNQWNLNGRTSPLNLLLLKKSIKYDFVPLLRNILDTVQTPPINAQQVIDIKTIINYCCSSTIDIIINDLMISNYSS